MLISQFSEQIIFLHGFQAIKTSPTSTSDVMARISNIYSIFPWNIFTEVYKNFLELTSQTIWTLLHWTNSIVQIWNYVSNHCDLSFVLMPASIGKYLMELQNGSMLYTTKLKKTNVRKWSLLTKPEVNCLSQVILWSFQSFDCDLFL